MMGRTWTRLVGGLAILMALAATDALAAQPDKKTEMSARQAFAAGRYDEALELFAQLYAETLHPVYLRNIGRCHQKKREPQKAIDAFRDYLAKGKVASAERREIEGYIHEMEQLRDEQAKDSTTAQTGPFKPAPPATTPPPPPAQSTTQPTPAVVEVHPATNANTSPNIWPPPPAGDATTQPAVTLTGSSPPADESHPFYTRWWFWTAMGAAAATGVVMAVVVSSQHNRPDCPSVAMGKCQ
jgi:hypothetical protein